MRSPTYELLRFEDPDELAHRAAEEWLKHIIATSGAGRAYSVALSGGGIAGRFFSAVAELAARAKQNLAPVQFFWSDERCVPPDDSESNFGMARDRMLEPLKVEPAQIHRIRGEDPPANAAAEAEKEVFGLVRDCPNGQPRLDLVFLGLGPEGHTASLFPGEPEQVVQNPAVFRVVTVPKPPPVRVTMGYSAIATAKEVWMLASGPGKDKALQDSIAASGKTPFARVLQMRSNTRIFTDLKV